MCGAMKTPCENRFCENWTLNFYCDECMEESE